MIFTFKIMVLGLINVHRCTELQLFHNFSSLFDKSSSSHGPRFNYEKHVFATFGQTNVVSWDRKLGSIHLLFELKASEYMTAHIYPLCDIF